FFLFALIELSLCLCYRNVASSIPRVVLDVEPRLSTESCRSHCTPNIQCQATFQNRTQTGCLILGAEYPPGNACHAPFTSWVKTEANCCNELLYLTPDYASQQDVVLHPTQKQQLVNGVQQFRCPPGSIFGFIGFDGVFQTRNWWLTCEPSDVDWGHLYR
ncbi:hypothetical protein PMAYCL1PPCAC_32482, partial [Pristionchus mayeri]